MRYRTVWLAAAIVAIIALGFPACGGRPLLRLAERPGVCDVGVPVQSVNWVRTHVGASATGAPAVFVTMGQTADNMFVLDVNPETGAFRQYVAKVKEANYPTATLLARDGRLYVGGAYAGHLLRYDPKKEVFEDLGAINPEKATFPCGIDEDAEGRIWIGSYGAADLTSFDPITGEFTRRGRMDDVDMYNYPIVNTDGMVCNRIMMTRPHCVVFDPKTGVKKTVGPVTEKGKDTFDLVKGGPDGAVYIRSSLGNFLVKGFDAVRVDSIPAYAAKPQPLTAGFADSGQQLYRKLQVTRAGASGKDGRVFDLDYKAAGSELFLVHRGPDGNIYGSSMLPLHLFRYEPASGAVTDMGKCSSAGGEAYSMANLDGKMYIASYPGATVSIYDPSKPYRYGTTVSDNPRDIGRIDNISYRPRSALAGPLGRVWFASVPDYGMWGGPLSWYDPATDKKGSYKRIAGDASCFTLAWLEKRQLIAVGTTIQGGTGTQPKVKQAVLFLWDYKAEKKVWEGSPDRPVETFNALVSAPDGKLYGTMTGGGDPELFAFDPAKKAFVSRVPLQDGTPLDNGLQIGPDGAVYGFTTNYIYRFRPPDLTPEIIVRDAGGFHVPGPIVGKEALCARGHILRAATLFR